MTDQQTQTRRFTGVVVSQKMQKTIVVRIDSTKWHKKYHKQYISSRRYLVHDENGQYREGDAVTFVECRPLSRHKRWRVLYAPA
ncbi:MAG: 30S ribosomal protein S17 [Parcubacteria group bacterium]|nr:30S ribosomal protein S17 [Parcubacteria group bacterium]